MVRQYLMVVEAIVLVLQDARSKVTSLSILLVN
jgi:hypothetical protein